MVRRRTALATLSVFDDECQAIPTPSSDERVVDRAFQLNVRRRCRHRSTRSLADRRSTNSVRNFSAASETRGEVDRGRRFSDAAFLVRDGDNHEISGVYEKDFPRSRRQKDAAPTLHYQRADIDCRRADNRQKPLFLMGLA